MTPAPVPIDDDLARDERWALAVRLVGSPHFAKAVQLRELLLYLAKRAIAYPNVDVSEQEIGCRVLGRRPDYNPQADNIVRVQIRRLRQKLDEYFAMEGRDEPVIISIPKGSHVLHFEPRTVLQPVEALVDAVPRAGGIAWPLRVTIPALAMIAAIAFSVGYGIGDRRSAPASQTELPANQLWTHLFVKDQPTSIVIADSSLVVVQNVLQRNIKLNEYINRSYRDMIAAAPGADVRDMLRMISNRQYTSLADAMLSSELRSIGSRLGARVLVRYARHMNIRDFNSGNFVLLGSRHGVPWVELFEPGLNFQFERIGSGQRFGFRNRQPLKGEAEMYESTAPLHAPQLSFATISMVPNLAHNGTVLMLNGITMEATEAAGEFAMSNEFSQVLTNVLGIRPGEKLPHFEILLRAASMAGAPHKVDVVAWRKPGT